MIVVLILGIHLTHNVCLLQHTHVLCQADDMDSDSQSDTIPLPAMCSSLAHTLLLALSASHRLDIFACGTYLLHSSKSVHAADWLQA